MRPFVVVLAASVSFACTSNSAGPDPVDPSDPQATVDIEDPGAAPRGAIELHPIALREGGIDLVEAGGRPYLLIDGEPIPLQAKLAPTRVAALGRGLLPIESMFGPMFEVVALAGSPADGRGILVVREDFDRAGSTHHVYELSEAGWKIRASPQHGSLSEFFAEVVSSPEGALLGVRGYELGESAEGYEYTDDSEESEAFWAKIEAEQASAPKGFALLSGTAAVIPTLPAGWLINDAISTSTGHIVALAQQTVPDSFERGPMRLLEWAPSQAEPTIVALPGIADDRIDAYNMSLWPAGERVLVAGLEDNPDEQPDRGYLALGRGSSWERVATQLPSEEAKKAYIEAAALADDGELWIVLAGWEYEQDGSQPTLWRQSGGEWRPVELPSVDEQLAAVDARERSVYDPLQREWVVALAGDPEPELPIVKSLLWSGGELWVIAELGRAYPTSTDLYSEERRTVVYATEPVDAPVWLPGFDRLQLERMDQLARTRTAKLGGSGCREFTIVVHADADAQPGERDQLAAKLLADDPSPPEGAWVRDLMLGATFDDPSRAQLVYPAYADGPKAAKALVEWVGKRAGVQATGDCRPRLHVRDLEG